MRQSTILGLFILLIVVIAAVAVLSGFLVDWLWFDSLGFGPIFLTVWKAKLAASFTKETGQSPVVMTTRPPGTAPPAAALPSSGTTGALQHYRQALDALRKGDWQTFGVEMDALQKAMEGATAAPPS
jgi:uncharacterized membrane protein (UPF0182 family)